MGGHVSCGYVRARSNRCWAYDVRRGGGSRRRRNDEQPRGAEVTLWRKEICRCTGPDGTLGGVHAHRVIGRLRPIGDLRCPVLCLMQNRTGHPTRNKRHEQEPDQNGAALMHELDRKAMQLQGINETVCPWFLD